MKGYWINGGKPLTGEVTLQGAKNAVLPVLAASLICESCELHNCPDLSDVASACKILQHLGCVSHREGQVLITSPSDCGQPTIPDHLMEEMRSSIVFLSAMIAKFHRAEIGLPGGCQLGPRPIDYHLSALEKMGVTVENQQGKLICRTDGRMKGAEITFPFPSVGATETVLIAAVTAKGVTTITNAAREPEIADLVDFLVKCGAKIEIKADGGIVVEGVKHLHGCVHEIISDRIVLTTYLSMVAAAGGKIAVRRAGTAHIAAFCHLCEGMGLEIHCQGDVLTAERRGHLLAPGVVRTMPYPGFPTDSQPTLLAVAALAKGTTIFIENIFENRFRAASQLAKMGAKISVEGRVAVVEGKEQLCPAVMKCPDLRGGASLVTAALAAPGVSEIGEIHHILRGYERFAESLCSLGAEIREV